MLDLEGFRLEGLDRVVGDAGLDGFHDAESTATLIDESRKNADRGVAVSNEFKTKAPAAPARRPPLPKAKVALAERVIPLGDEELEGY